MNTVHGESAVPAPHPETPLDMTMPTSPVPISGHPGPLRLLAGTPAASVARLLTGSRALIVYYHQVYDVDGFAAHLDYLRSHYRLVSLLDLVLALEGRRKPTGEDTCDSPGRAAHRSGSRSTGRLGGGGRPLAAITFDDGYRSLYASVHPLLVAEQCPATVFVNTASIESGRPIWPIEVRELLLHARPGTVSLEIAGRRVDLPANTRVARIASYELIVETLKHEAQQDIWESLSALREACGNPTLTWSEEDLPLTWAQLREMVAAGFVTVGNHTHSHRILPWVDPATARHEIATAQERLHEELAGSHVPLFCYPNGEHNPRVVAEVRRAGYIGAVATHERLVGRRQDALTIPRMGVSDLESLSVFAVRTSGALIPLRLLAGCGRSRS